MDFVRIFIDFEKKPIIRNNQWFNFTNWPSPTINPIINQGRNYDVFNTSATDNISSDNFDSLKNKQILSQARLLIDGKEYTELKTYQMFKINNGGIYRISFELFDNPANTQSTGYLNLSKHSKIELELHLIDKETNKTYNYEFILFSHKFNNLKITSGMGNLEYAN